MPILFVPGHAGCNLRVPGPGRREGRFQYTHLSCVGLKKAGDGSGADQRNIGSMAQRGKHAVCYADHGYSFVFELSRPFNGQLCVTSEADTYKHIVCTGSKGLFRQITDIWFEQTDIGGKKNAM
jgi:hypothetical protein